MIRFSFTICCAYFTNFLILRNPKACEPARLITAKSEHDSMTLGFRNLINVGNVVEWLERLAYDKKSWFKTHSRHSVVSLEKTLYGTFPCLVVSASSSKF